MATRKTAAKGTAGTKVGTDSTQCKPGPLRLGKPCGFAEMGVRCEHAKKTRALRWRRSGPFTVAAPKTNELHVVPELKNGAYEEHVWVDMKMAALCSSATHPWVTLRDEGAKRAALESRGKLQPAFTITYPAAWFSEAAALGLLGLPRLFFPAPRRIRADLRACGTPASAWGHGWFFYVVAPGDTFKLDLTVPALGKIESSGFSGARGGAKFSQRTQSAQLGRNSISSSSSSVTRGGTTRTLGGAKMEVADPAYQRALESMKITRETADISQSLKVTEFAKKVDKIRGTVTKLIDFFERLDRAVPRVGWMVEWKIELLSGSLNVEWGWRENPANNLSWKYVKGTAKLKILDASFEVGFGAKVLGVVAKLYASVSLSISLSGTLQTTAAKPKLGPLNGTSSATVEVGVAANWRDTIRINGKVTTGIELDSDMTFAPFKWDMKAGWKKGEGAVSVNVNGWEKEKTWTFWEKTPIDSYRIL